MGKAMIWDKEQKRMVEIGGKDKEETLKISITQTQFDTLKQFAKEDGYDFKGISYETEKDKDGKTKKNNDGNVVFKLDKDGKKITHIVEESQGKINSAIAQYVGVAIDQIITERLNKEEE